SGSADHRRDDHAGARSGGTFLSVLSRARQLPRAHLRLRRAPGDRKNSPRNRLCPALAPRGAAQSARETKSFGARWPARTRPAQESYAICPNSTYGGYQRMSWIRITRAENIPLREGRAVKVGDQEVAIFNLGEKFLAVNNRCPHRGGPLADGIVSGNSVVC